MSNRASHRTIDFSRLDRTIHEKSRLAIMTLLAARSEWSFQDIKAELGMSDGNLITHLRSLHSAGFVSITKEVEKRPLTRYALTSDGKAAFDDYLSLMEQIVRMSRR